MIEVFRNLEAELKRKNITRLDLTKILGLSISTVSLKLNGKSHITFDEALKLKKALNTELSLEFLFATD